MNLRRKKTMIKIECNEAEVQVGMQGGASQLFAEACMTIRGIWESLGKVKPKDSAIFGRAIFEEIVKSGVVFTTEDEFQKKFDEVVNNPELHKKAMLTKLIMELSEKVRNEGKEEAEDGEVQ
jgi:predicted phosphatase